jgi:hypothetical protein
MTARPPSWKRDLLRRILLGLIISISILAIIYALTPASENVWLQTKRELEARGETLDWAKFIPTNVPPEQNLFEHPAAAALLPLKNAPVPANALDVPSPAFPPDSDHLGFPFTIPTLKQVPRDGNPDEITLASLDQWFAQWDEAFAQLREAGRRPAARLPGVFTTGSEMPILSFVQVRTLAQVLGSRAKLHLLLGNPAAALEDLDTISVVLRALDTSPATLVAAMIRVAVGGLYVDVVEEGLRANLWRDADLAYLTSELNRMNFLPAVQNSLRAERANTGEILSALATRRKDPRYGKSLRELLSFSLGRNWSPQSMFVRLAPGGWIRRGQAHHARVLQEYIDATDPVRQQIDLRKNHEANTALTRMAAKWSPHSALVSMLTPNLTRIAQTVARTQTRARQAALACAIKQFQVEKNRPPNDLAELVPHYIAAVPANIFTGEPMLYRQTTRGWELSAPAFDPANPNTPINFIWNGD